MIFVDTGGWFASIIPTDKNHIKAKKWFLQNREPLITTTYVVDETLTLFKARGEYSRALQIGDQFFNGSLAGVYDLNSEDIVETWEVFKRFSDKEWSFTDCSSKVERRNLESLVLLLLTYISNNSEQSLSCRKFQNAQFNSNR